MIKGVLRVYSDHNGRGWIARDIWYKKGPQPKHVVARSQHKKGYYWENHPEGGLMGKTLDYELICKVIKDYLNESGDEG